MNRRHRTAAVMLIVNAVVLLFAGIVFFGMPGVQVILDMRDPALRGPGVLRPAVRLFRTLTPRVKEWANARLADGKSATHGVSSTEWPLFGSVFYLWATESLQEDWERDPSFSDVAPKEYAREAIDAATALLVDPNQAAWVRDHWGEDYLHRQNAFYRMLVIAALTSHHKLTGEAKHLPMLRDQVETLSAEIDASPHGLLDDYPGECYPTDVLAAVAMIRRADAVLGTDHSAFVERARRAFSGNLVDARGLPPYSADASRGVIQVPSRGCGNSYACLFGPELWPDLARTWYASYTEHFWQYRVGACGFREFAKGEESPDWYMGPDAGPVVFGHGFSASAFGVGAARVNGRFDHACPLTAQMLAISWPLPNGTLAAPRLLSDAALKLRKARRVRGIPLPAAGVQFGLWALLVVGGAMTVVAWSLLVGIVMLAAGQSLPRGMRMSHKMDPVSTDRNHGVRLP